MLKRKGKKNYKDQGCTEVFGGQQEFLDQKTKLKTEE